MIFREPNVREPARSLLCVCARHEGRLAVLEPLPEKALVVIRHGRSPPKNAVLGEAESAPKSFML